MSDALGRLTELLAERTSRPLTPGEQRELGSLLSAHPDWREDDFDLAAGALVDSLVEERELPAGLAQRIRAAIPLDPADTTLPIGGGPPPISPARRPERTPRRANRRNVVAWIAAAAAGFAAVAAWWPQLQGWISPAVPPEIAARDALLASPSTLRQPWAVGGDPLVTSIEGEVVWNNEQQQGFMRFKAGMPANDPRRDQYQLWIFDAQRDERYPIDGGVFDVTPGQEVIVPIRAALRVKQPTLFAVTLEPPGGVVVSDRKHILVVAKVGG